MSNFEIHIPRSIDLSFGQTAVKNTWDLQAVHESTMRQARQGEAYHLSYLSLFLQISRLQAQQVLMKYSE